MDRKAAIQTIMTTVSPQAAVVTTTGLISREVYEEYDAARNIYVPGSMGLASSIGLGLALSRPDVRVVVIDGDASILMNLGSLVTIGYQRPANLLHIILDNGAYGSCSEEASMSGTAHLHWLAKDVGYAEVRVVGSQIALEHAILGFRHGPGCLITRVDLGGRRDFRRPDHLPALKDRFRQFFRQLHAREVTG